MGKIMRLSLLSLSLLAASSLSVVPAIAATHKKPAAHTAAKPAAGPNMDTVVGIVDGHKITLTDLSAAIRELPPQARQMPPQQLYPLLLDQMIDREALVIRARKDNLQAEPDVKAAMERADDQVLQNALLRKDVGPQINEQALRALYDKEIGTKPGPEEVKASHILVPTEKQAQDIIAQLNKGADFATLAKKYSTDPTGKDSGGDLGYFKEGDMVPEFSKAAFALKPGQFTQTPVHTRYGWHVIKVFDKRQAPPPSFDQVKGQLQQQLVQQLVKKEIDKASQGLKIERFNSDGTPATNGKPVFVPPPGAKTAGAPVGTAPGATPASVQSAPAQKK